MMDLKKLGLFVGGALFGSAGIKVLSSDDAKKLPRKPRLNLPKPAQRWRIWHEMQDFA